MSDPRHGLENRGQGMGERPLASTKASRPRTAHTPTAAQREQRSTALPCWGSIHLFAAEPCLTAKGKTMNAIQHARLNAWALELERITGLDSLTVESKKPRSEDHGPCLENALSLIHI